MTAPSSNLADRANSYVTNCWTTLETPLGFGFDGIVYSTGRLSAIKVFRHDRLYQRERDVYLRLQHHQVVKLLNFKVPQLIEFDDVLQVVEMTIVSPPFVLDFAGAYLDRQPPFDEEIIAEWRAEKAEQFGDRWPAVRLLMSSFVPFGIYLADVKPGNIEFAPSASSDSD